MIIDHFSTFPTGGAGGAAARIHAALLDAGVASRFWHRSREFDSEPELQRFNIESSIHKSQGLARVLYRAKRRFRSSMMKFERWHSKPDNWSELDIFSSPKAAVPFSFDVKRMGTDLMNLHWISSFVDYRYFFRSIPEDLPLVWTLHDMNAFTGGCHFTNGCQQFQTGCNHCPQLKRPGRTDLSSKWFDVKYAAIRNKNLHVVAPSRWMEESARSSRIFSEAKSFQTIPLGIDVELFSPQDPQSILQEFQVPSDTVVIGFGAESLTNPRKGFHILLDALNRLASSTRLTALVFGQGKIPEMIGDSIRVINLGFIRDQKKLVRIYSALDLFILPSLEDNLPQTGLEAMACGVPVIGFDAGGIPDYVRPGETGALASVGDPIDLAAKIDELVDRPELRERLKTNARALIVSEFQREKQTQITIDFYRQLIQERDAARRGKHAA